MRTLLFPRLSCLSCKRLACLLVLWAPPGSPDLPCLCKSVRVWLWGVGKGGSPCCQAFPLWASVSPQEVQWERGLTLAASVLSGITAAALATSACIVGILCLPLILLLVYKQRQVASNRREYPCPPGLGGCVSDLPQHPPQPQGLAKAKGRHNSALQDTGAATGLARSWARWWREEGIH